MGAIAEAFVAYAQPLLDETDGSVEQMERALAISQLCFNVAQLPEESRDKLLDETKVNLEMDDEEFDEFRYSIVVPMIRRYHEMFPPMLRRGSTDSPSSGLSFRPRPEPTTRRQRYPVADRYAPCPCNSGLKYKFCCGKKST